MECDGCDKSGQGGSAREGVGCVGVDEDSVGFVFWSFVAVVKLVPVSLVLRWSS